MGGITSALGIGPGPGAQGLRFGASGANLTEAATPEQLKTAYEQSQQGIANQAAFLSAIQGQNGIANQSAVYNQLQGIANGTGPNPATALLSNATGANNAAQAALMAGQRGAGSNVGLIARQAAQQGAANQQNSIGQAAALQAQQQQNAIGAMSGVAANQVANQAAATGAYTGATQGEQSNLLNSVSSLNNARAQMQANQNNVNASMAQEGAKQQSQLFGGVLNGAASLLALAKGGEIPPVASPEQPMVPSAIGVPQAGPKSSFGKALAGFSGGMGAPESNSGAYQAGQTAGAGLAKGFKAVFGGSSPSYSSSGMPSSSDWEAYASYTPGTIPTDEQNASMIGMAHGGKVPALVSPGERYLSPKEVKKVADGKKSPIKAGEKIPGSAKVKGDSLKNDVVHKNLEEGGIVLPRSVTQAKDAPEKAAAFVRAILAKKKGLKNG